MDWTTHIEGSLRFMTIRNFLFAILLAAAGCSKPVSDAPPELPATQVQIGSRQFTLEKDVTASQQGFGLMRRDDMPADHGMIFVYPQNSWEPFKNHNVRFPIDCVFLDSGGQIVSIQQLNAYSDDGTTP